METEEVSPGIVVDGNNTDKVVGVELLRPPERAADLNLSAIRVETAR